MTIMAKHPKRKALVPVVINYWIPGKEEVHVSSLDLSEQWLTEVGMLVAQGGHEVLEAALLNAVPSGRKLKP